MIMKITPLNTRQLRFKSSQYIIEKRQLSEKKRSKHPVLKNPHVGYHSNYTYFFREDLAKNWEDFVRILDGFYKNADKVNIYNFACSDGSESYSLAMKLKSTLGEKKSKKFFPIHACDIDSEIIRKAKSGKLDCFIEDTYRIDRNIPDYSKYCNIYYGSGNCNSFLTFVPNEKLKNCVQFSEGDFAKKIDEIPLSNSILMCRNFWYYLGEDRIFDLLIKIRDAMDETTLLVIGDFDRQYIKDRLEWLGFKEIALNVYKKEEQHENK